MALKLIPEPTFNATVMVPLAGRKPAPVVFTFRHLGEQARIERDQEAAKTVAALREEMGIPPSEEELAAAIDAGTITVEHVNAFSRRLRETRPAQVLTIATGWDLVEPFNTDNLAQLFDSYAGAFDAIWDTFREQLGVQRTKN